MAETATEAPCQGRRVEVNTSEKDMRRKMLKAAFRLPSVQTMRSRKSSITNAFVNSVIPVVPKPTLDEIEKALSKLGMDLSNVRMCVLRRCNDRMGPFATAGSKSASNRLHLRDCQPCAVLRYV